jgi:hypothetical protein
VCSVSVTSACTSPVPSVLADTHSLHESCLFLTSFRSRLSIRDVPVGDVVTLCLNDAQRMLDAGMYLTFSVIGPVAIIVVLAVLLYIIGIAILAGFAVLVMFFPLQRHMAARIGKVRHCGALRIP